MKKAIIYGRQSSGKDDISESIEVQVLNCKNLAEKENLEIIGIYKDLNSSGKLYPEGYGDIAENDIIYQNWLKTTSTRKKCRPGLGEVFARLSEIDYIIVDDFTRLARPLSGSFLESTIQQLLYTYNVKVLTVKNGEMDLNNFNDSLIATLQNRINDAQIAIQRKKSMDGLKKLRESGESIQGIGNCLGFKSTGKKHEITIDEKEAEIIRYCFDSVLDGLSMNEITKRVNEKYPWVSRTFNRSLLRHILQRPLYTGYFRKDNGELAPAKQVPYAIIDFNKFMAVQKILTERKTYKNRPKYRWSPLSGRIICGECGAKMIVRQNKRIRGFYTCVAHHTYKRPGCKTAIPSESPYKEVNGLTDVITPLLLLGLLEKLENIRNNKTFEDDIKRIEIDMENLSIREEKFTDMYFAGTVNEDLYQKTLEKIAAEKAKLSENLLEIKAKTANDDEEEILTKIRHISNGNISQGQYEELMRLTIIKIESYGKYVKVYTPYGNIDIPKIRVGLYVGFPKFSIRSIDKKIYYHTGDFPDVYKAKLIKKLGDVSIYFCGV